MSGKKIKKITKKYLKEIQKIHEKNNTGRV